MAHRTSQEEQVAEAIARMGPYGQMARLVVPELDEDSRVPITFDRLAEGLAALASAIEAGMADEKRNEEDLGEWKSLARCLKRFMQRVEEAEL